MHASRASNVALAPDHSFIFILAPAEKCFTGFMIDFLMGGVSATISKIAAAPYWACQNQDEMLKFGHLVEPYKGIVNCFAKTMKDEGIIAL